MEETWDLVEVVGLESIKEGKSERKVLAWDDGRTLLEKKIRNGRQVVGLKRKRCFMKDNIPSNIYDINGKIQQFITFVTRWVPKKY